MHPFRRRAPRISRVWIAGLVLLVLVAGCSRPAGGTPPHLAAPFSFTTDPVTTTTTVPAPTPTTAAHAVAATTPASVRPPVKITPRPVAKPKGQVAPVSGLTVPPVSVQPVTPQPPARSPAQVAATVVPGVVDIDSVLADGSGYAAGTGSVLTSSGLVLTNNHVVEGSVSFVATEVATNQSYAATVVGVDPAADVAVLQLVGAPQVPTVTTGDSATVAAGQAVVAIGNAGGVGGPPAVTGGTVEAIGQEITASDDITGTRETLTDMIESDTETVPGDSGGPLVNESGAVIGMVTAGAVGNGPNSTINVSFAIPIDTALGIVQRVEAGQSGGGVLLGLPGALGVEVTAPPAGASGALITAVTGSGALGAGLVAGDTITTIGSTVISGPAAVASALLPYRAGAQVTVGWTDAADAVHDAPVTLAGGPAD